MKEEEIDFENKAEQKLKSLERALHSLGNEEIEVDLVGDVLTIEIFAQAPIVINRHFAAKQIWMSAARKAWHFQEKAGVWLDVKTQEEFVKTLEEVLSSLLKTPIHIIV